VIIHEVNGKLIDLKKLNLNNKNKNKYKELLSIAFIRDSEFFLPPLNNINIHII